MCIPDLPFPFGKIASLEFRVTLYIAERRQEIEFADRGIFKIAGRKNAKAHSPSPKFHARRRPRSEVRSLRATRFFFTSAEGDRLLRIKFYYCRFYVSLACSYCPERKYGVATYIYRERSGAERRRKKLRTCYLQSFSLLLLRFLIAGNFVVRHAGSPFVCFRRTSRNNYKGQIYLSGFVCVCV